MSIARQGGILPNGKFVPQLYSARLQAKYFAENVVPLIANHDYDGEISKLGDTVNIRKRPNVDIKDYVLGQDLVPQEGLADESIQLTIDYADYFDLPIRDVDKFEADIDFAMITLDEAAKGLSTKAERRVLQSIYTSATSTVSGGTLTAATVVQMILQCGLKLNQLNVPQTDRYLIVDPTTAYLLNLSDLKAAYITGDGATPLRDGNAAAKPIGGFKVYVSNNLSITTTTAKCIAGHRDALCFASQINQTETIRNQNDFGNLLRGLNTYGFKVVKPEALCLLDVTGWTL